MKYFSQLISDVAFVTRAGGLFFSQKFICAMMDWFGSMEVMEPNHFSFADESGGNIVMLKGNLCLGNYDPCIKCPVKKRTSFFDSE